jgi:hypothetical protein
MALDRKTSLAVAGGTVAVVYATFQAHLPPIADERAADANDPLLSSSVRSAAWASAAAVAAVSLITKDMTVFVFGGLATVALTWLHRHANLYDPVKQMVGQPSSRSIMAESMAAGAGTTPGR